MQVKAFDRVVTMTAEDAAYLKSYAPDANVRAVPIGIDADAFAPQVAEPGRPVEVIFVGNFNHSPNVEAARFLAQKLAPRFPDISFRIHGAPVPEGVFSAPNVTFPGYVPDTRALYRRPNTIVAAPLFSGTGQRVKLLEAFAMGCPVVTTSVGAMGFPVRDGVNAIVANTESAFVGAIEQLAGSLEYRTRLGNSARQMIVAGFTWEGLSEALLHVVEEASLSH
jgi:glycosyltransferase involved in cell wall biosynthesis